MDKLDHAEALRYLGYKQPPDQTTTDLLALCEGELLAVVKPKYTYKIVGMDEFNLLTGEDIKSHLKDCNWVVLVCATLGNGVDTLIRTLQISDMAKAVIADSLASVAIEQVFQKALTIITDENPEMYFTWGFSPGYGDYPIEIQRELLTLLDAPRKIGLCTDGSSILTPIKSITSIVGMSKNPVEKRKRGCQSCNLKETCEYRKRSEHCDF